MNKEHAISEAQRMKAYFPFRSVGVIEVSEGEWEAEARKTMAVFNKAVRERRQVFIFN